MKPVAKVYQEVFRKKRDLLFGFWLFASIMVIVTVLAGVWLFTLSPLLILAPSLVCAIVLGFLYRWLEVRLQHLIYDEDTEMKGRTCQDRY
jgi:hypothetical protein